MATRKLTLKNKKTGKTVKLQKKKGTIHKGKRGSKYC